MFQAGSRSWPPCSHPICEERGPTSLLRYLCDRSGGTMTRVTMTRVTMTRVGITKGLAALLATLMVVSAPAFGQDAEEPIEEQGGTAYVPGEVVVAKED